MKSPLSKLFHFLGGVYFALILIGVTTLFVIAGTFLEAASGSHGYAASFTYSSPLFAMLLGGFFINILFAALRRWPFKKRHIPFLITHVGLLMILGGTLIKHAFGVQGILHLVEGSGSHEILLPQTQALSVETRNEKKIYSLKKLPASLELLHNLPHASEKRESWIKEIQGKRWLIIQDVAPLLVNTKPVPLKIANQTWNLRAITTENPLEDARQIYLKSIKVRLTDRSTQELLLEQPLSTCLETEISWKGGKGTFSLQGLQTLSLHSTEQIEIPLQGAESLINFPSYLGAIAIDLVQEPALLFMIDKEEKITVALFDPYGRTHVEELSQQLPAVISYDRGFGGYTVPLELPHYSQNRSEMEKLKLQQLASQLRSCPPQELSAPLHLLYSVCQASGTDFATTASQWFDEWKRSSSWLYLKPSHNLQTLLEGLDWSTVPASDKKACYWLTAFYKVFEPALRDGRDLNLLLQQQGWPFPIDKEAPAKQLTQLSQQIFAVADHLPEIPYPFVPSSELLSAYMRGYNIHLDTIPFTPLEAQKISLETPLSIRYLPTSPTKKLEDNRPMIALKMHHDGQAAYISLGYDPYARGLKWPLFQGKYRLRFQPQTLHIPYHVRLSQARQISYAGTNQPYSYECDISLSPTAGGPSQDVTISMNHVHETAEGYRFYLSNLTPPDESAVKQIQLVVNYDPAKYWLTYSGGLILALGIFLLFFWKPR